MRRHSAQVVCHAAWQRRAEPLPALLRLPSRVVTLLCPSAFSHEPIRFSSWLHQASKPMQVKLPYTVVSEKVLEVRILTLEYKKAIGLVWRI